MITHYCWRPRTNLEVVVTSVSCGFVHHRGFVHDHFIITGDFVQLMWIESRLKVGLNFEQCADLGVDDGDKMVTILSRLVTWSNQIGIEAVSRHRDILLADEYGRVQHLQCPMLWCEMQTGTSRNLIVRTSWELERYVNIEILKFIYIVNCQAEEGLVRAHASIPCGCPKESRVPTMVESDACFGHKNV